MYGSFSDLSLRSAQELFDFTLCRRADGTTYGSRGKCRKGTEITAKDSEPKVTKPRAAPLSKHEKIAIKVMADKSLRSDRKRIAEMVRLGVPKDTEKDRSTFTVGDSLDYAYPRKILGSPVRDPANPSTRSSSGTKEVEFDAGGGTSSNRMTIRGESSDLPSNPPYVEAQIHGGLRVADIQEVRYYRGHEIPAATRRALEKQGVRIVELPPQMNSLIHYADSPGYRDIESLSMEQ